MANKEETMKDMIQSAHGKLEDVDLRLTHIGTAMEVMAMGLETTMDNGDKFGGALWHFTGVVQDIRAMLDEAMGMLTQAEKAKDAA